VVAGGRTGLTSVVTGSLFFVALLFSPLVGTIGNYPPVTAPALLIVGSLAEAAQRQGAGDRLSVVPDGRTAARVLRPDPLPPRSINASPQRDTEEIQRGKKFF